MQDAIKDKIRKLLALAASTESESESDLAMTKAQQLMDLHRIAQKDIDKEKQPYIKCLDPIVAAKRLPTWKAMLFNVLSRYNNCFAVMYKINGENQGILFGRESDIDHVRYLFAYCITQLNTASILGCLGESRTFRTSWFEGAVSGIRNKLEAGRQMAIRETGEFGLVKIQDEYRKVEAFANSLERFQAAKAKSRFHDQNAYDSGFGVGKSVDLGSNKRNPKTRGALSG